MLAPPRPYEAAPPLRTLVIQHHKENLRKCSLTPIRGRRDLEILAPRAGPSGYAPIEIDGGILLRVDAPPLCRDDRAILRASLAHRLILIDCNWIKVPKLLGLLRPRGVLAGRSLPPGIRTAYPRRSKIYEDPADGLATVEALAAAYAILGFREPGLLAGYPWARKFLELNPDLFS